MWRRSRHYPDDDASRQKVLQAFKYYKYPTDAVVYAGPYRIRGTVLSPYSRAGVDWSIVGLYVLREAAIDSQPAGAKLTGSRVPWLLLSGVMIHGVEQA